MTSYPYPREIILSLSSNSFSFAKVYKYAIGSAPGDNINIIGMVLIESSKAPFKSNGGDSVNF